MSFFDLSGKQVEKDTESRYKSYKKRCEAKYLKFDITLQEFNFQINRSCYICSKQKSGGLDRVDNNIGYTEENIYPCCFDCNRMKSNKTKEQFLKYLARLNPNHELLISFNRLKDYDLYNKKVSKVRKLMKDMWENPDKYERKR